MESRLESTPTRAALDYRTDGAVRRQLLFKTLFIVILPQICVTLNPKRMNLEVVQVLRRYCVSGEMSAARAQEAIVDLLNFPITRYPHDIFIDRIWDLRNNMTAYDAAFVALAESLPAPLLTLDAKLAAASGHRAKIILIPKSK